VLNNINKNFSRQMNKIFMCARVLLFVVHCNFVFWPSLSLSTFGYTFSLGVYYILYMK